MSRSLSMARVSFEGANIALENVIIGELEGKPVPLDGILAALNESETHLANFAVDIAKLNDHMRAEGYQDLPPVTTGRVGHHGTHLATSGAVAMVAWEAMWAIMRSKGFYGVLGHFDAGAGNLKSLTATLRGKVHAFSGSEHQSSMVDMLEQNRSGNFRLEFAQLYCAWAEFQQEFLASAMISTETWYLHTRVETLIPAHQATRAA